VRFLEPIEQLWGGAGGSWSGLREPGKHFRADQFLYQKCLGCASELSSFALLLHRITSVRVALSALKTSPVDPPCNSASI
jgi:hypothetical protein